MCCQYVTKRSEPDVFPLYFALVSRLYHVALYVLQEGSRFYLADLPAGYSIIISEPTSSSMNTGMQEQDKETKETTTRRS